MVGLTGGLTGLRRPRAGRVGRTQERHVRALAARRDVLVLRDGRCVAVLEVTGRPVASLPATEQLDVLAAAGRAVRRR